MTPASRAVLLVSPHVSTGPALLWGRPFHFKGVDIPAMAGIL